MASQVYNPNVGIGAIRGWCLKYVDDAGSSPQRSPNARTALNKEINAYRIRMDEAPIGLWVVGFLDLLTGSYAGDDHVFFMKNLGGGRCEIRDSETNSGQRGVYNSIQELLAWFRNYTPQYVGWSTQCDGRVYVDLTQQGEVMDRETVNYIYRGMTDEEPTEGQAKYWTGRSARELSEGLYRLNEVFRYRAKHYVADTDAAYKKGLAEVGGNQSEDSKKLKAIKDAILK